MSAKTYPCVVKGRIVELTADQRDAIEHVQKPVEQRLAELEAQVTELREHLRNQGMLLTATIQQMIKLRDSTRGSNAAGGPAS